MSNQLQQTITSIEQLSATEQVELIKIVVGKLMTKPVIKLKLFDMIFQLLRQAFDPPNQPSLKPEPTEEDMVINTRNGVPLFPEQPNAGVATLELVNELRDEDNSLIPKFAVLTSTQPT